MGPLFMLIGLVLSVFQIILLLRVLLSWLPNIDPRNPFVKAIYDITEPVLRPVREVLPATPGIDFSPLLVFLAIYLLRMLLPSF